MRILNLENFDKENAKLFVCLKETEGLGIKVGDFGRAVLFTSKELGTTYMICVGKMLVNCGCDWFHQHFAFVLKRKIKLKYIPDYSYFYYNGSVGNTVKRSLCAISGDTVVTLLEPDQFTKMEEFKKPVKFKPKVYSYSPLNCRVKFDAVGRPWRIVLKCEVAVDCGNDGVVMVETATVSSVNYECGDVFDFNYGFKLALDRAFEDAIEACS